MANPIAIQNLTVVKNGIQDQIDALTAEIASLGAQADAKGIEKTNLEAQLSDVDDAISILESPAE